MLLTDNFQSIGKASRRDDRGPVLVIMENGDIQHLFEFFLDVEALRRFDIFKIDPAKSRRDRRNYLDNFIRIVAVYLNIEYIHIRELLKKNAFTFHHGLPSQCTTVAKAQDSRT